MIVRTGSADETRRLGVELAARLRPDGTALLFGDLGSGKTVLTQGIAAGLGLDAAQVQSPTFTLIHEYEREVREDGREAPGNGREISECGGGRGAGREPVRLVHVDLYRLEPEEVDAIGVEEFLAGDGVKVVEWADRLPHPPSAVEVRLRMGAGPRQREIEINC